MEVKIYSIEDQMPGIEKEVYGFSGSYGVEKLTFGIPNYKNCDILPVNKVCYHVFWNYHYYSEPHPGTEVSVFGDITHWCYVDDFVEEETE